MFKLIEIKEDTDINSEIFKKNYKYENEKI